MLHYSQLINTQNIPTDEEFFAIPNYEGKYYASKSGIIINSKTGKSISSKRNGYKVVGLTSNGKIKIVAVHRIIAKLFVENPENKTHVNHIDGNKKNNNSNNLEWVTHIENMEHARKLGVLGRKRNPNPKKEIIKKKVLKEPNQDFSFATGYKQVMIKDSKKVQLAIMSAIGVKTRVSWLRRLNGYIEPKVSEVQAIESIFAEYGIKNVWGE
jgi:cystathionine beta-lyase family protein involved in aluminum resistance